MELELQPIELEGVSKERPVVIAGPCSAETEEQVMSTATQLANKGIKIFRAGIWKPRTKPGRRLRRYRCRRISMDEKREERNRHVCSDRSGYG